MKITAAQNAACQRPDTFLEPFNATICVRRLYRHTRSRSTLRNPSGRSQPLLEQVHVIP
jgi:hypothetical protein